MQTYVALLRGINVGGNNKVSMSFLKKIFEGLAFSQVRTYINSGNVIFTTEKKNLEEIVRDIETTLHKKCKFPVRIVLREAKNIQKLCKEIPANWTNDKDQRTDILFLWDEFDKKATLDLIIKNPNVDTLLYSKGAVIWNMKRKDYKKSALRKFIGTPVYKNMTARNVNTVRKLAELMK